MEKQYEKRVRRTRRGPEGENKHRFTQTNTKIISNLKTSGHDGIQGFWLKKFTSIHDRIIIEMNRCLQETDGSDWNIKIKTILIQKHPFKGLSPKNTDHNMPTYDVEK